MRIIYTFVIGDLFHYGHLQLLKFAKSNADKLICGVLTDEAVCKFKEAPICNFKERFEVVESIKFVDKVITQLSQDPTVNLAKLQKEYPGGELTFLCGLNWKNIPGEKFIVKNNIKLLRHTFYDRLSNENIFLKTIENKIPTGGMFDTFSYQFEQEGFIQFRPKGTEFLVTTKAKTLQTLKPLLKKSKIESSYVFTVKDWNLHTESIIKEIQEIYYSQLIVIRSSCIDEDACHNSKAGYYHSELNISSSSKDDIVLAIDKVVKSYVESNLIGVEQVLVQKQTINVKYSGVVFTRGLKSNTPYYEINYDEKNITYSVTSGRASQLLRIHNSVKPAQLDSPWNILIDAVHELEQIIKNYPLDIEFAITEDGGIILFQVRPLAANIKTEKIDDAFVLKKIKALSKEYTNISLEYGSADTDIPCIFSDMAFWNPAELIGEIPSDLAYSIFNRIVMDNAWNYGLVDLGYPKMNNYPLMKRFLYKPYINVSFAFEALTPGCILGKARKKLLNYYSNKLQNNPYLHDKIEFEIVFSCYDFDINNRLHDLKDYGFSSSDIDMLRDQLVCFTKDLMNGSFERYNILCAQINKLKEFNKIGLEELWERIKTKNDSSVIEEVLDKCKEYGVIPFVTAARCAFIGKTLLNSLVKQKVISDEECSAINATIKTIATELTDDINCLSKQKLSKRDFIEKYGHLRSGTYDIKSPRYAAYNDFFTFSDITPSFENAEVKSETKEKLEKYLRDSPLHISYDAFYSYINCFTVAREEFKFVFTKTVSNCLELLKKAGDRKNIAVKEIELFSLDEIGLLWKTPEKELKKEVHKKLHYSKKTLTIHLPPLIMSKNDFVVVKYPISKPNFIGADCVSGSVVYINEMSDKFDLKDKVVLIENADPGYHWIFSKNIKALITKYGGVCSHMAICCAEMKIPAVIGCGEIFDSLKTLPTINIDCKNQSVKFK